MCHIAIFQSHKTYNSEKSAVCYIFFQLGSLLAFVTLSVIFSKKDFMKLNDFTQVKLSMYHFTSYP